MEEKNVRLLLKELIWRAYEAYEKQGTVVHFEKLFKCPKCEGPHLEYKTVDKKEILKCLDANCSFRVFKPPTIKELQNFFEQIEKEKRDKLINKLFQEIIKEDDEETFSLEKIFKFI